MERKKNKREGKGEEEKEQRREKKSETQPSSRTEMNASWNDFCIYYRLVSTNYRITYTYMRN